MDVSIMDMMIATLAVAYLLYQTYRVGWHRARGDRGRSRIAMLGMAFAGLAVASAVFYFWFTARLDLVSANMECLRKTMNPEVTADR